MKKKDLATLALLGMSAGLIVIGCHKKENTTEARTIHAAEQMAADMKAFYDGLTPEAQKKFMQLDAQHKMMAIEMTDQGCNGKNKCAGMGGCASTNHQCAGQNSCKGSGGAPIQDANKAVDIQFNNQMSQRQKAASLLPPSGRAPDATEG